MVPPLSESWKADTMAQDWGFTYSNTVVTYSKNSRLSNMQSINKNSQTHLI